MSLPRVRITTRRMMVAVGMIALVLGMRRQSAAYRQRAEAYALITIHSGSSILIDGEFVDKDPATRVRDPWAWKMAEKYWRLSDYPWLPVEPDKPPPPEARSHLTETLEPPMRADMANLSFRHTSPAPWTFLWTWHW